MKLKVDIKEACQLKRACFEMIMKYEGLKVQADGEVRKMYKQREREWIKLYDKLEDQINEFDIEHGGKDEDNSHGTRSERNRDGDSTVSESNEDTR